MSQSQKCVKNFQLVKDIEWGKGGGPSLAKILITESMSMLMYSLYPSYSCFLVLITHVNLI